MAKSHKAQHWVPRSYLSAWTDPDCAPGHEPFVHVFSRDASQQQRRAPANLFAETDLYTIHLPDGGRDLRLEHGLSSLEGAFADMRREFLEPKRPLSEERHVMLMAFVAAMHVRTPMMRDHHMHFWKDLLSIGEEVEQSMRGKSIEEKKRAARVMAPSSGPSMSMEDVRRVVSSPMENTLGPHMEAEVPLLLLMRAVVLCTDSDPGFITTDNPVVWFDPEACKRPPMFQTPAFMYPTLEITLPISPRRKLVLLHGEVGLSYLDVDDHVVTELNRRTRGHCRKTFVSRRPALNPIWLDPGKPPPDAWENVQGRDTEEETQDAG